LGTVPPLIFEEAGLRGQSGRGCENRLRGDKKIEKFAGVWNTNKAVECGNRDLRENDESSIYSYQLQ
jgi:hypothetical protein